MTSMRNIMTQIALWSDDEGLELSIGQGEALARRIIAATPSSPNPVADNPAGETIVNAPRVRELVWRAEHGYTARTETTLGVYAIMDLGEHWGQERYELYATEYQAKTRHPTLEAAKAAAQSNYERRVLACLVDAPVAAGWPLPAAPGEG